MPPEPRPLERTHVARWKPALAGSAITLGVGALVGSWALYAHHRQDGARFLDTPPSAPSSHAKERAWDESRTHPFSLAAAGSLTLTMGTIGMAFTYGPKRLPLWMYLTSAGVGAALVTAGAVQIAQGDTCSEYDAPDRRSCALALERRDSGALLLIDAFPFLIAPAFHALWRRARGDAPRVAVSAGKAYGAYYLRLAWRR
jgi:hypothetical protein